MRRAVRSALWMIGSSRRHSRAERLTDWRRWNVVCNHWRGVSSKYSLARLESVGQYAASPRPSLARQLASGPSVRRSDCVAERGTFNCWINNRLVSHHFDDKSTRRLGLSHWPLLRHPLHCWTAFHARAAVCYSFKNRTPDTFYYNFAKIVLISIKTGTHNMHMT